MRVYAISLEKGGTGKSSVAVNLAVAFQQRGQRVLLIDLDAQGHASRWLGVDARHSRPEDSILGVIRGRPLGEGAIATEEGVAVVPANPEMAGLPVALASAPNNGLFSLRAAVAQMAARGGAVRRHRLRPAASPQPDLGDGPGGCDSLRRPGAARGSGDPGAR
jgi:chromosome partitioning protein